MIQRDVLLGELRVVHESFIILFVGNLIVLGLEVVVAREKGACEDSSEHHLIKWKSNIAFRIG